MAKKVEGGFLCPKCKEIKKRNAFGNNRSKKNGVENRCKLCRKLHDKEWYLKNREKSLASSASYYKNNKGKKKIYNKKYKEKNKDKIKVYRSGYRKKNKEAETAYSAEWYRNNKERVRLYCKEYRRKNPERVKANWKRRQKQRLSVVGNFTKKEFIYLCSEYGNICLRCKSKKKLTIDHVIPISKGGTNNIDNIQPLCGSCNSIKHTKNTDYRIGVNKI